MTHPPCLRLCPANPGNPRNRIEGESPLQGKGHTAWGAADEMLTPNLSLQDPGCVKTHVSVKCEKYNSPGRIKPLCAQHGLTSHDAEFLRIFYARGGRLSFHTASTHQRHWLCTAAMVLMPS